jgi:hypothetical protein
MIGILLFAASSILLPKESNGHVEVRTLELEQQAVEKVCIPYTRDYQSKYTLAYFVSHQVPDRELAFVVISICHAYNHGYTDRLLAEKSK